MKIDRKKCGVLSAVMILIVLAERLGFFTAIFHFDKAQSIMLAILIMAAFLWVTEWIPLYITSLLILFTQLTYLLPHLNLENISFYKTELYSSFFSDIILLFLGGFVMAAILHKYHLDRRLARILLSKAGEKPSRVLFGIMGASAILSMWMSNTATAAMMFAVVMPVLNKIPENHRFSRAVALSIPFACNLGGLGTPIGTPPNAIALSFLAKKGITITFSQWMAIAVPIMIILIFFVWILLLKLFPPLDLKIQFEDNLSESIVREHWIIIALCLMTIVGWLTTKFHGLSLGSVSLVLIIAVFALRLLGAQDLKGLSWDVLIMVGGGICLGVGLQESGLTKAIVTAIPTDQNRVLFLGIIICVTAVMTTLMSNTATANLLIPIAVSLDYQAIQIVIPIALVCSTAMALPISTPPNAIAFGSGLLTSRDMVRPGGIITLVSIFLILGLGIGLSIL